MIPNSAGVYGPFSFDVSSETLPNFCKMIRPGSDSKSDRWSGLHGNFSFDMLSRKYLNDFKISAPRRYPNFDQFICPFLIWCVVQTCTQSFWKSFTWKSCQIPTGLYGACSFDVLSRTKVKCFKKNRPRNDPKPDRFIWLFLTWRVVLLKSTYFLCSLIFRPRNDPTPDRFIWPFRIRRVVQKST